MEIASFNASRSPAPALDAREIVTEQLETLHVVAWEDPVIDCMGVDPRSSYVEAFWLPLLGPSATLLMRRFACEWDDRPEGFDLDLDDLAVGLGLGTSSSRHSPLRRSLGRCQRFGLARTVAMGTLAVRRRMPQLSRRHQLRLPTVLQEAHRNWVQTSEADQGLIVRRRARLVALDLRDIGVDDACIERHLLRRGVHPAIAFEAARWAWSKADEEDRPYALTEG